MSVSPQALRLSMVSGNSVNSAPRLSRTYRKMADIGVQCDPQDSDVYDEEPPFVSTVAEINTSAESGHLETTPSPTTLHPLHRPPSTESSASSSSGEDRERRRPLTNEDLDVDAICSTEEFVETECNNTQPTERTVPDGFVQEKEESTCGLDCLYFTMQCCECTIL